jgi:prepilin-type N-terminal cleavage/methylation domain-containing protein
MRANRASPTSCRSGFSLIETLVVIVIITIMVSLLMPALQHARAAANRAVCENNLHQIALAGAQYLSAFKKYPDPAPPNSAGGWSVELLVFLEEKALHDQLTQNPSLNPVGLSPYAMIRPKIETCPLGRSGDSNIPKVPLAHYVVLTVPSSGPTPVGVPAAQVPIAITDAPIDFQGPWVNGPMMLEADCEKKTGPHDGGFLVFVMHDGSIHFSREAGFLWP